MEKKADTLPTAAMEGLSGLAGGGEPPVGSVLSSVVPDGLEFIDLEGRLTFLSKRTRSLFEIEDAVGLEKAVWTELWPGDARKNISEALTKARGGEVVRFEAFRPTRRGTPKWWDVSIGPVRDGGGLVQHLLAISRDITQLKSAISLLSASEQRFRALADNMAQLAWMADASGHVLWLNKRWIE
ncbi:MAG: PAS domain-containing protein, partial [Proteobacteria bacterium]|nr:PAS domain-containing protein [Pseudomonadota bacterium]